MEKTKLSNKGQVVIPKAIRARRGWKPGLEFVVEDYGVEKISVCGVKGLKNCLS